MFKKQKWFLKVFYINVFITLFHGLDAILSTHTHTTVLLLFRNMSGTTRVSRYQKGKTREVKTNLNLLEQEIVSGSGICWAICKSAPHPRLPRQHPTTQFLQAGCPSCHPTNSVKALKVKVHNCRLKAATNPAVIHDMLFLWYHRLYQTHRNSTV